MSTGEDRVPIGRPDDASEPQVLHERSLRARRRRRRERDPNRRGFAALLPNLFTTGNLAAGFYAIVKASQGDFERAAVAIIFAGIFDALDGRIARMAQTTSRFGVEYDSIADTVSFGVAPAMLAFHAGHLEKLGWTGWVMAFMFTVCAALRLARFNVSPGRYAGRFEGLASPAGAGMVLATTLFAGFLREQGLAWSVPAPLVGLGVVALGLLMVSPIPYRSFKDLDLRHSYRTNVFLVIAFGAILLKPAVTLFLVGIVYVSSGPVELFWRWRTGRSLEELPEPARDAGEGTL
ncbi:MAG: CDP-diacylglycerol--serine O-phosphatidyltransferase [Deltaproteobacteria bacterium]|nr:MAG: CDP-diacylglycerol--serine O-phosphatidyltransferase [Deltaproteobacteria bacterium]